ERPEVGDLIAFLRAAANPNDGAALLAVLRGPLGGVPDSELAAFAAEGGRLDRTPAGDVDATAWAARPMRSSAGRCTTLRCSSCTPRSSRGRSASPISTSWSPAPRTWRVAACRW